MCLFVVCSTVLSSTSLWPCVHILLGNFCVKYSGLAVYVHVRFTGCSRVGYSGPSWCVRVQVSGGLFVSSAGPSRCVRVQFSDGFMS